MKHGSESHEARKALFQPASAAATCSLQEIDRALPQGSLSPAERWLLFYSLRAAGVEIRDSRGGSVEELPGEPPLEPTAVLVEAVSGRRPETAPRHGAPLGYGRLTAPGVWLASRPEVTRTMSEERRGRTGPEGGEPQVKVVDRRRFRPDGGPVEGEPGGAGARRRAARRGGARPPAPAPDPRDAQLAAQPGAHRRAHARVRRARSRTTRRSGNGSSASGRVSWRRSASTWRRRCSRPRTTSSARSPR